MTRIHPSEDPYTVVSVIFKERPCACATTDCTEMVRSDDYTYPLCVKCEYHGCPIKKEG